MNLSKQEEALLSENRKEQDDATLANMGNMKELTAVRRAKLKGAEQDMKEMGLRVLGLTANIVKAIAQPTKRKFVVTYQEEGEQGWQPAKVMKFSNMLESDEIQEARLVSHGFSLADKINFKPFLLKSNRAIDEEEGLFLDAVERQLGSLDYTLKRPVQGGFTFNTALLTRRGVMPGTRESSIRHTSLYQIKRCTTLIVADSVLGSQGGNGYLRVTTCQLVLPGAKAWVLRRFADWLLLHYAKKVKRVVFVGGTNDIINLKNPTSQQITEVAEKVVTTICLKSLERHAIPYWILPPYTKEVDNWKRERFAQALERSLRRTRGPNTNVTWITTPRDVQMRKDNLHPMAWSIPWILLKLEDAIQEREGGNNSIIFDRAQAENLFMAGDLVRQSISLTPLGNGKSHSLWNKVEEDELATLARNLIPHEAPGFNVTCPSDSPYLSQPKKLIQSAYDEFQAITIQNTRNWDIFPELKVMTEVERGHSIIGDQLIALITEMYKRRPVKMMVEDVYKTLALIVEKGVKEMAGGKVVIDTSDMENWLTYDSGWIMPRCMELGAYQGHLEKSEEAWHKYFFSLTLMDLVGVYAMMGGEIFAQGPDAMQEVTDTWQEDDWFTAKLLLSRKALKLILKLNNPENMGKNDTRILVQTKAWGKADKRLLTMIKHIEETQHRRITIAELAIRLGVHPLYVQQALGNHVQALWGYTGHLLPDFPKTWLDNAEHIFHLGSYLDRGTFKTNELMRNPKLPNYQGRPVVWKDGYQDLHSAVMLTYENEEFIEADHRLGKEGMVYELATSSLKSWAVELDHMGQECRDRLMKEIAELGPAGHAIKTLAIRAIDKYVETHDVMYMEEELEDEERKRACPGCIRTTSSGRKVTVEITCEECNTELCVPCDYKKHLDEEGKPIRDHQRSALPGVTLTETQAKVLTNMAPKARKPPQTRARAELEREEEAMNPNVVIRLTAGSRMVTAGDIMRNTVPTNWDERLEQAGATPKRIVVMTPTRLPTEKLPATTDEITRFMNTGPLTTTASQLDNREDTHMTTREVCFPFEEKPIQKRTMMTTRKKAKTYREEPLGTYAVTLTPEPKRTRTVSYTKQTLPTILRV